ncbi:hypothetical protein AAG747_15840 [Rapidithrix thailandica]|uniref:Outer membrane protein beta-barrel domain-containing protein n=1 Tax=Rapidithrix thailandica TaxID=413964 RepID=A0AAW9SF94_9BACT
MRYLYCWLTIFLFLPLIVQGQSFTKDKSLEVDLGLGYLDLLHLGMKYRLSQNSQIGMSYGGVLLTNTSRKQSTVTLEHLYHFGRKGSNTSLPLYYFSQKLSYVTDNRNATSTNLYYLTGSIGKSFYANGPFGVNLDIGLMVKLHDETVIDPTTPDEIHRPNYPPVFPAFRFQFFFDFK